MQFCSSALTLTHTSFCTKLLRVAAALALLPARWGRAMLQPIRAYLDAACAMSNKSLQARSNVWDAVIH